MTVTIHKVTGGDGYNYLTEQVATGDELRSRGQSPEDYYGRTGEPPGYWIGRGAADRDLAGVVDSQVMHDLWAKPAARHVARTTVAGFDFTFSPAKSISTLWAVAPTAVQSQIEAAHRQAVDETVAFLEQYAATRPGVRGVEVAAPGFVGSAFEHRVSRLGDPDLHTHVAVMNRGLSPDGKWRALVHLPLYRATVSASEHYNARLEDHLVASLGVAFEDRPRPNVELRPVREIVGVDPDLMRAFSGRRQAIEARVAALTEDRGLNPRRSVRADAQVHRWATLDTRQVKGPSLSLADRVAGWRRTAEKVLGPGGLERMLTAVRNAVHRLDPRPLADVARDIRERARQARAVPQRHHIYAEAERQLRAHPAAIADRDQVVTTMTETVMTMANPTVSPAQQRLLDLAALGARVRQAKAPSREHQALTAAGDFYRFAAADSWVPDYMATRRLPAADAGYAPGRGELVAHLRSLGFTDEEMIRAGLAGRTDRGRMFDWFRDRAVFPLREATGQIVGFTARESPAAKDDARSPKYLNSPGQDRTGADVFRKGEVLYGLNPESAERLRRGAPLVIVEGPMDAVALDVSRETSGFPSDAVVVAACGTAVTREHLLTLDRIAPLRDRPVFMVLDNDAAGVAAQVKAYALLRDFGLHDLHTVGLPWDPAETLQTLGPEFVAQVWEQQSAPLYDAPVFAALANWTDDEGDFVWAEKKVGAMQEVAPIVAAMPEQYRARQIEHLSTAVQIPVAVVTAKVQSCVPVMERLDLPTPPKLSAGRGLGQGLPQQADRGITY